MELTTGNEHMQKRPTGQKRFSSWMWRQMLDHILLDKIGFVFSFSRVMLDAEEKSLNRNSQPKGHVVTLDDTDTSSLDVRVSGIASTQLAEVRAPSPFHWVEPIRLPWVICNQKPAIPSLTEDLCSPQIRSTTSWHSRGIVKRRWAHETSQKK